MAARLSEGRACGHRPGTQPGTRDHASRHVDAYAQLDNLCPGPVRALCNSKRAGRRTRRTGERERHLVLEGVGHDEQRVAGRLNRQGIGRSPGD